MALHMKLFLSCLATVALIQLANGLPTHLAPNSAANVAAIASGTNRSPAQFLSGQFQGDMVLTQAQWMVLNGIDTRTGLVNEAYRWHNREVPYAYGGNFDDSARGLIRDALTHIQERSCLTFVERTSQDDYITFRSDDTGCWSWVGRLGGSQDVNIQLNGCLWFGTVVHEVIHAIGFYHMQSATERDNYVSIHWENIQSGTEHNFDSYGPDMITNFGVPYDIGSIMHYDAYAFSSNGQPTITAHDGSTNLGTNLGMTGLDQQRINAMYC